MTTAGLVPQVPFSLTEVVIIVCIRQKEFEDAEEVVELLYGVTRRGFRES